MTEPGPNDQRDGEENSGQDEVAPKDADTTAQASAADAEHPGNSSTEEEPAASSTTAAQRVADPTAEAQPGGDPATAAEGGEASATGGEGSDAGPSSADRRTTKRNGLLIGAGVAVVIVVLVLAAAVWPGFLAGPGAPNGEAAAAVAALASKDPAQLEKVSCRGHDGKSTSQLPAQAMQLIQSVKPSGPVRLILDTQAEQPVDLALAIEGQVHSIPVDVVLGVTHGGWCMYGMSTRQ